MEQPNFCLMKIPHIFLNLPSIHGFTGKHMNMHFKFCPLLSLLEWCVLEPVYAGNNLTADEKQKSRPAYSKLHYAFISFIASQKKFESRKYDSDSDSDDQEEGELLEDNEGIELFLKMDVIYLVQSLQEYLVAHKDRGGGMLFEYTSSNLIKLWFCSHLISYLFPVSFNIFVLPFLATPCME